ncbi:MAG: isoprenylcysteine carboxylmethyltransferase family protein [Candidatus Neomarinimicrobiota bacterium]
MNTILKERNGEHPWGDLGQLIALVIFMAVWVIDSFWLNWTTFGLEAFPNVIRMAVAVPIWILAGILIKVSHFVIDRDRRPAGVISTGAFRFMRHPVYLSALLVYLGLVISSLSLATFVVWVLICLFYNYIAAYEELLLIAKYGEAYRAYQRRTGRWLPKLQTR